MAYTSTDLQTVQNAIIALASGERIVSFTIGDRTFSYGQVDLDKLRALRDEISSEVATGTTSYILTSTSKGL